MEDEKEPDEQPPFQWNKEALLMLVLTGVALVVPLLGVAWFVRDYFGPRMVAEATAAPTAEKNADTSALAQGLERMTDERFSTTLTTDVEDGLVIEVDADDMDARIARIAEIAKTAGGSALDLSEPGAKSRRVTIQVPKSRYDLLKRAIRGDLVDFSAIPASVTTRVLQVDLKEP